MAYIDQMMKTLILALAFLLTGCAPLTEQGEYDRKDRIIVFMEECKADGRTIVYTGPTTRRPIDYIHRHAQVVDYSC